MNWNKREIAYQHVHMFYGFWFAYLMSCVGITLAPLFGLLIGMFVEAYQYYILDENLYLFDRIRDIFFWGFGGFLTFAISV